LVSVIHLRQLEAAKKLGERKYGSEEDKENTKEETKEITEKERLFTEKAHDASDAL